MISVPSSVRIFMARDPVDFRKAFDGLCAIIQSEFGDDPFSGHIFLFFNKRRDRVKLLFWDRNGFWLLYKRLERGTFEGYSPSHDTEGRVEIDPATLHLILEGIELKSSRFRRHFVRRVDIGTRGVRRHGPQTRRATG
jgi:transposase